MPENEHKDKPGPSSGASSYLKYSAAGFQMIAVIGFFTYIGYRIDKSAHHTTQWVTAMLSLIGVFMALFIVIRSLRS
jgi:predicted MFS family arabinose efflux permease